MMKEEFCAKAGIKEETLSSADYAVIEKVYATHPAIDANQGKQQIANIYNLPGGMRIIRDMVPTAEKAAQILDEMQTFRMRMDDLKRQYDALKK